MGLGLGIDTGGTYTDAAIVDFSNGSVIAKAKALTTRGDLYLGITDSIGKLEGVDLKSISLVSLSSTLATNSVVEGKGYRVGLMIVGGDYKQTIPVDEVAEISGGHNLEGEEAQPLDVKAARDFVTAVKGKVDSFAISSFLSVRNPSHELELKKIVQEECDHPVICGHELSSKLGLYERTITAVLNARLIPIISDLVASVKKVLEDKGIEAPLMIVKGDGSLMGEETARLRPVETILSGPAATEIGPRRGDDRRLEDKGQGRGHRHFRDRRGQQDSGQPRRDSSGSAEGDTALHRLIHVPLSPAEIGGSQERERKVRVGIHRFGERPANDRVLRFLS
jgi:N-methylhydantoinase A/oxoprolinase/acetone carboxylase beta subunit